MTQPRDILEAALRLTPAERAQIAAEILESLRDSPYGTLSPEWEEELQSRLRDAEAGRAELTSAERVFADVEAELRERRVPR
jgi:putative addiction module component (TIGR02574 family)